MKAPDKIYILHHEDYSDRRILNAFTEKEEDTDIEYIRKDTLLEWTKEQASNTEKLNGKGAMLKAWDTLIEKIESL